MAHKRMFSKTIVDTDAFQDMSQTAQLLYFHLNMQADDDGFVGSPKRIMRSGGFNEDDMKVLVAKRFILTFDSGVVVIKHWLIHNTIRKDRYNETTYKLEKKSLKVKQNKGYTEIGNQMATIGEHSIEEDSIEEDRSDLKNHTPPTKTPRGFLNARRKDIGKEPMTPRKATDKQKKALDGFKKGIDYFKEVGYEQHGMQFLLGDPKRNGKLRKIIGYANEKIDNLNELVDWWFDGNGEWADYEPEQCFSNKSIERFINKGKGKKNKDKKSWWE